MFKKSSNIDTIKLALSLQSIVFKQAIFVAEEYYFVQCDWKKNI